MSNLKHSIIVLVLFLSISLPGNAQVVTWQHAPTWTEADVLYDNILRVKEGGKYGLFRSDGTNLIPCVYDRIAEEREGFCLLLNEEGGGLCVKGIIDVGNGNVVTLSKQYYVDASWPYFSEGLLNVKSGDRWGFISPEGEVKVPFKYILAFPFSMGLAVVRFPDGIFCHIDKRQNVSYGTGRLKANKFRFASTFVQTDYGPMAIVAIGNSFYGRDLSGELVPPELPIEGNRKSFTKQIVEKSYTLEFNDAWQPARVKSGSKNKEYHGFEKPSLIYPLIPSITANEDNGVYDLRLNGKVFISAQFESVVPVTQDYILAKQAGRWGLLRLLPLDKISVEALSGRSTYSHGSIALVPVRLNLPASLSGKRVTLSSQDLEARRDGDGQYTLSVPINHNQILVDVEVDGIRYPSEPLSMQFSFKRGFSVYIPAEVKLNEMQVASFGISITNVATTPCDYAEVYVDGALKKSIGPLGPSERELVTISMAVPLGDEDEIKKSIVVEIREDGCPPIRSTQEILFTRHFND